MNYAYYIVDVFTQQLFNGAQIAVLPNANGLSATTMQQIARELNLSETVFISAKQDNYRMRIFTPVAEVDFAGHPIIAAAYVLAASGKISLTAPTTPIVFEQNIGCIAANISSTNGQPSFVQFSHTVKPIVDRFAPTDAELAEILAVAPAELDHKKFAPRLVSCGFPYLIVPVWNYAAVRKARFNYNAWSQSLAPQTAAQEILLFAAKSPNPDADFHARLLGPRIGLLEDPPIGSAMPALCAYLCSFEHTQKGTHVFAVERGELSSRRSVLNLEMDNKREEALTIRVGGQVVLSAQGTLNVPASV